MTVYIEIAQSAAPDQTSPLLVPGKFVQGTVTTGREILRSIVPARAISNERLLLVEDDQIVARDVAVDFRFADERPEFGVADRQWAALRDDLPPGAQVVLSAPSTVTVGSRVQAVPASEFVGSGGINPAVPAVSTIGSGAGASPEPQR